MKKYKKKIKNILVEYSKKNLLFRKLFREGLYFKRLFKYYFYYKKYKTDENLIIFEAYMEDHMHVAREHYMKRCFIMINIVIFIMCGRLKNHLKNYSY